MQETSMRTLCGLVLSLVFVFSAEAVEGEDRPRLLPAAHAHNDYLQKRPLVEIGRAPCRERV